MTETEWMFYREQVERGDRLEVALKDVLRVFGSKVHVVVSAERREAWAAALQPVGMVLTDREDMG